MTTTIEYLYLLTGLALPLFYVPQIIRLAHDQSRLESYSMVKAFAQLVLRLPTLLFAYYVVDNTVMNIVLTADVLGRLVECVFAIKSLRCQGMSSKEIIQRFIPKKFLTPSEKIMPAQPIESQSP